MGDTKRVQIQDTDMKAKLKKVSMEKPDSSKKPEKIEQEPIFAKKLKKTETVKIKLKETKLESVQLKHHEFEQNPQDNSNEQPSSIIVSEPLQYTDDDGKNKDGKEKEKKQKKRQIKKIVKKKEEEITDSAPI